VANADNSTSIHRWRRELLPLCTGALLLLVLAGGIYLSISKRLADMKRLYTNDNRLAAATYAAGMAINANDAPALRAALEVSPIYGPKETAQLLKELADIQKRDELGRVLLDHCTDIPHLPGEILHQAILWKNYGLARTMIEKGANVNAPGEDDPRPPLACAIAWGDGPEAMAVFELLLKKGADPGGRTNPKAATLLHKLVFDKDTYPNRVRIARMLIDKGADVNATAGDNEMTPLALADDDDTDPLVQLLKSKGGKRRQKDFSPATRP
jgi:ankyrin repeat protein